MSEEFDDAMEPVPKPLDALTQDGARTRSSAAVPRLVSRLYAAANRPLRAKLLACLLRPLGPLGLVAIASGAFAGFLQRGGAASAAVAIDDAARFSREQIAELARFVEQVSPDALQQFASLIADNPVGIAAFSASAAVLLLRALRRSMPAKPEPDP